MGKRRSSLVVIAVLATCLAILLTARASFKPSEDPASPAASQVHTIARSSIVSEKLPQPSFAILTPSSGYLSSPQTTDEPKVELLLQNRNDLLADPYGSYPMDTVVQLAEAGDAKAMNRAVEWLSSTRTGSDERFVNLVLLHTASSKNVFSLVRAGIQARETRPEIAGGLLLLALNLGYQVDDGPDFQARQTGFEDFVYQRLNALDDPSRAYARMDEFRTKLSIIEGGEEDAYQ